MASFYLGQIMLTGFNFAQKGFALCNGQLLPINQNAALFSLLGTQYGGDGRVTFQLPNMQSSTPVGAGLSADPQWQPSAYTQGQIGGNETVTLAIAELPSHTHFAMASTQAATVKNPANAVYANASGEALYGPSGSLVALNPVEISPTGGNTPHDNMQPYLVINFNIALTGIYPSRS